MEIPVYLFTGFLEAGKTKFIRETMQDENFNDPARKYLIIQCEEGDEELEAGDLGANVSLCTFEREDDLVADRLIARQKRAGADVIIIEYNGMWTLDKLYAALPESFMVYQEIFIADSTTIGSYNANMRQLVVDKLILRLLILIKRQVGFVKYRNALQLKVFNILLLFIKLVRCHEHFRLILGRSYGET